MIQYQKPKICTKFEPPVCYRKNDVIFRRCGPDDDVINCIDNVTTMTLSTQNQFLLKNAGEHQHARQYGVPMAFDILVT